MANSLCITDMYTEHEGDVRCPSFYIPSSPDDVLLSESDCDTMLSGFRSEQRTQVARDLNKENNILRRYIEAGNLGFWFKNLLSSAEIVAVSPDNINEDRQESAVPVSATPETSNTKTKLNWL